MIKSMNHNIHPLKCILGTKVGYVNNNNKLHCGMGLKALNGVMGGNQEHCVGVKWPWE